MFRRRLVLSIVAVLTSVGPVACGEDGAREAPAGDIDRFVALFVADAADYEPANGPAELASDSELVIRGTIADIVEGRSFGTEGSPEFTETAVMEIEVSAVLEGRLPRSANGRVHVELFGVETPDAFAEAAPAGAEALLYLVRRPVGSPIPGTAVNDPNAGRPAGQPLYGTVTPEGFFLEGTDVLFQPENARAYPGATLEDVEPDKQSFPRNFR